MRCALTMLISASTPNSCSTCGGGQGGEGVCVCVRVCVCACVCVRVCVFEKGHMMPVLACGGHFEHYDPLWWQSLPPNHTARQEATPHLF